MTKTLATSAFYKKDKNLSTFLCNFWERNVFIRV